MAIWPEERLREHVEAAGGRARVDATTLLEAFRVRQVTPQARENVRLWLEGVGVTMEPPVLPPGGEVTLAVNGAANGDQPGAVAWDDLEAVRRPSVLAYASRLCPPERIAEAAEAAFAAARERAGYGDADAALLESTRDAVAERTRSGAATTRPGLLAPRRSNAACASMPKLLAGRASGRLGEGDLAGVARHLARCPSCSALEQRRDEAERAYRVLAADPAPKLSDVPAPVPAPSPAPEPAEEIAPEDDWLALAEAAPADPPPAPRAPLPLDSPARVPVFATAPPAEAPRNPPPAVDPPAEPGAGSPPPRSPWPRRIAIAVFVVGFLLTIDAVLTVTWKEPVSAFLQAREQNQLEEELAAQEKSVEHLSAREETAISTIKSASKRRDRRLSYYARNFARRARDGQAVGRLRVEGLGEWVVVEGTGDANLRKAPGRYRETVMPGMRGTVAVAGHRTTYGAPFRRINEVKAGRTITFTMPYGRFTYRVQGQKIVPAGQSDATRQVGYNRIVLTACHPLYSAKQRILVFGRLEKKEPLGAAARDIEEDGPVTGVSPAEERAAARDRARRRLKLMGKRLLGPGMKGRDVKTLQRLLGVPQTGTYDPLTEYAVRDFQQKQGLGADGRAGAATKRRLARRPRPPSTPPTPPPVAPVPPRDRNGDGRPDQPSDNPTQPGQPPQPGLPAGGQPAPGAYGPPTGVGG